MVECTYDMHQLENIACRWEDLASDDKRGHHLITCLSRFPYPILTPFQGYERYKHSLLNKDSFKASTSNAI